MEKYVCYCASCNDVCYATTIGKILCPTCGKETIATSVNPIYWNGYSDEVKNAMKLDFTNNKYTRGKLFKLLSFSKKVGKRIRPNIIRLKCDTNKISDSGIFSKLLRYYEVEELLRKDSNLSDDDFEIYYNEITVLVTEIEEHVKLLDEERREKLKQEREKREESREKQRITMDHFFTEVKKVCLLNEVNDGIEFEIFCKELLLSNGYINVMMTPAVGDHGADILASDGVTSYAIQCKYYTGKVGNSAVQQIFAAKTLYNRQIGVVMTNSYFTAQAKAEAKKLGIKLWDRETILKMEHGLIDKGNNIFY